jgi:hypothetical protein
MPYPPINARVVDTSTPDFQHHLKVSSLFAGETQEAHITPKTSKLSVMFLNNTEKNGDYAAGYMQDGSPIQNAAFRYQKMLGYDAQKNKHTPITCPTLPFLSTHHAKKQRNSFAQFKSIKYKLRWSS